MKLLRVHHRTLMVAILWGPRLQVASERRNCEILEQGHEYEYPWEEPPTFPRVKLNAKLILAKQREDRQARNRIRLCFLLASAMTRRKVCRSQPAWSGRCSLSVSIDKLLNVSFV